MMTIRDYYSILLNFFASNTLFNLEKNFKDLLITNEYDEEDNKRILILTLEIMEKDDLIKKLGKKNSWILVKKFEQFEQTIKVNGQIGLAIARIINHYCDKSKNETDRCDPLAVTERDIVNLLILTEHFITQEEQRNQQSEEKYES